MGRRTQKTHELIEITLGALAAGTASGVTSKLDANRLQGARFKRIRCGIEVAGKTANEGPIIIGYALGIGMTEVAESFVADPQRHEDPGQAEEANRQVVPTHYLPYNSTITSATPQPTDLYMKDVPSPSFQLLEGENLNWFAYNRSGAALTTGTVVRIEVVYIYEWLND